MGNNKDKFGDLKIDLNHFFRYVYGGFLLCLITVIIFPQQALVLYNNLGGKEIGSSIFIVLAIIAIGTGFYVLYKNVISELIIDFVHLNLHFLMLHPKEKCVFHYLESLGVKRQEWITAFRLIRDKNFNPDIQKIYFLRHSETHVLYLTATACLIGLVDRKLFQNQVTMTKEWLPVLKFISITALIAGVISDMRLCADECSYAKLIGKGEIKKTLTDAKIIPE